MRRTCVLLFGLAVPGCTGPAPLETGSAAIINGVAEDGQPAAVYLSNPAVGVDCSGALVSERVVLTAKHCVLGYPDDSWSVSFGPTGSDGSYAVESVTTTPGDELDGQDVALMKLAEAPGITPYPMARVFGLEVGDTLTIVGYGVTETGSDGRKRRTAGDVYEVGPVLGDNLFDNEFLLYDDSTGAGHGDSGGPVLDGDGTLVGVMSRANTQYFTFCTRPDRFLDLIDQVIGAPVDEPECTVDADCAQGSRCAEGACVEDADDPIEDPDPDDCVLDDDCAPPLGGLGDTCESRTDCDSGICGRAGGSESGLCTMGCTDDAVCGAGFACLPDSEGGGVCWPAERSDEPAGLTGDSGCRAAGRGPPSLAFFLFLALVVRRFKPPASPDV